jgi:hypothetical protein
VNDDVAELLSDPHPSPARIVRVLAQVAQTLRRHEQRLDAVYERFLIVDELPESAPFGALIRLRTGTLAQRTPVYVGNGAGQPLTKLVPTAL